jgi:hypothetical protein
MADLPGFPRDRIREQINRLMEEERDRLEQVRTATEKRRKAYLDGAAIAIALLAASFTGWQAWEAHETRKEAAEMALDSLHTSQRAYVSVEANLNAQSLPILQFRTSGNSPAVDVVLDDIQCGYRETAERNMGGGSSSWDDANLGRVLVPGTVIAKACPTSFMGNRNKHVLVYGTVAYKDIFGKSHLTEFCYSSPTQPNRVMEACLKGNRVD